MIHIKDKASCCGCGACFQICPKQCISLSQDKEGFLYPIVDDEKCIQCGLCEKVCPVINQSELKSKPLRTCAAINKNEGVRLASSSGGVFWAIAEVVIKRKGVVFGARFDDNWSVIHDCTETLDGLASFQGSKYVQSIIGDCYKRVKSYLDQGRMVLFSGTPCQTAGLNLFLRKHYSNLITVDLICHGVPSPKIWKDYLNEKVGHQRNRTRTNTLVPIQEENIRIESISFRDKAKGWKKYSFALAFSKTQKDGKTVLYLSHLPLNKNLYLRGFLANLYLRPCCYNCPSKSGKSGADITLANFWNVHRVIEGFDDNKGTSLVIINSENGSDLIDSTNLLFKNVDFDLAIKYNSAYHKSTPLSENRNIFFTRLHDEGSVSNVLEQMLYESPFERIGQLVKQIINRLTYLIK